VKIVWIGVGGAGLTLAVAGGILEVIGSPAPVPAAQRTILVRKTGVGIQGTF
jgi:hypothetical protein